MHNVLCLSIRKKMSWKFSHHGAFIKQLNRYSNQINVLICVSSRWVNICYIIYILISYFYIKLLWQQYTLISYFYIKLLWQQLTISYHFGGLSSNHIWVLNQSLECIWRKRKKYLYIDIHTCIYNHVFCNW